MVEHFCFTISLSVIPFCLTKSWMDFVNSWDTCSFRTNVKHCTLLEYKWIWQLEGFAVKDTNFHTQFDTTIFVISHHIIIYTTFAAWYFSPWLHWFLWLEYSNNMSIQKMQSFWHIIGMPRPIHENQYKKGTIRYFGSWDFISVHFWSLISHYICPKNYFVTKLLNTVTAELSAPAVFFAKLRLFIIQFLEFFFLSQINNKFRFFIIFPIRSYFLILKTPIWSEDILLESCWGVIYR